MVIRMHDKWWPDAKKFQILRMQQVCQFDNSSSTNLMICAKSYLIIIYINIQLQMIQVVN